jgi:hypothetical protein
LLELLVALSFFFGRLSSSRSDKSAPHIRCVFSALL